MAEFTHRNGRTARMHASGEVYLIMQPDEALPKYIDMEPDELQLKSAPLPAASPWGTVYINGGKKDKLSKVDIVGLFMEKAGLPKKTLA